MLYTKFQQDGSFLNHQFGARLPATPKTNTQLWFLITFIFSLFNSMKNKILLIRSPSVPVSHKIVLIQPLTQQTYNDTCFTTANVKVTYSFSVSLKRLDTAPQHIINETCFTTANVKVTYSVSVSLESLDTAPQHIINETCFTNANVKVTYSVSVSLDSFDTAPLQVVLQ